MQVEMQPGRANGYYHLHSPSNGGLSATTMLASSLFLSAVWQYAYFLNRRRGHFPQPLNLD